MIIEPVLDQLKVTGLDLCEVTQYPELDKYKDRTFKIDVNYNMKISMEEHRDLITKKMYEEIYAEMNIRVL